MLLEEKKDEVYKLSQRLVKVDIDMSKLEMSRAAVLKNRDRKKTSTLTTTVRRRIVFYLKPPFRVHMYSSHDYSCI